MGFQPTNPIFGNKKDTIIRERLRLDFAINNPMYCAETYREKVR